jgi:TonB family protein
MTRKERFGKLVLLEETEASLLGTDYRAAKLGATGLEKIVTLLRLRPAVSANGEAARRLMDQVKLAAQLQSPNILKIFGIGKVEASYYVTYEFLEGRSLQQILDRCRQEGYPFAIDHALLIASKVCAALEHAHARKNDAGARTFHGLLTPSTVLVSFEGEVRIKGFGYWPSHVREAGLLLEAEERYLAPEQLGGPGEARSDLYGLGAILFETLTGQPPPRGVDPVELVGSVRIQSPSGEQDAVPKPLSDILLQSLASDPNARYGEVSEMRKAIDTVLFSGDFTPTTFNLAFFMHSLFRDDMEREAKMLQEERAAKYTEYLEEPARAAIPARSAPASDDKTEPFDPRMAGPLRPEPPPAVPAPAEAPAEPVDAAPPPSPAPHPPHGSSPSLSSRAAAGFTFHREEGKKKMAVSPLVGAAVGLLLLLGAGAFYLATRGTPAVSAPIPSDPPPSTLSPDVLAAQQRVKELEEKLASLEAEKRAAESRAAEDATKKVEAQAKASGQEVDQAALQRAQEDARQKARQDEERRQREELRRVEEQKRAEEARLAEERKRAEEAAAVQRAAQERAAQERAEQERLSSERLAAERAAAERAAAEATPAPPVTSAPPPTTLAPTPASAPPLRPGTLVSLSDPGVIAPVLERKPPLPYPPIALRQRAEGTVDLNVLVDERGNVTDAQVVAAPGGRAGLPEAAQEYARRWKYRPATKDGVPVKVWTPVKVKFALPR